MKVCFRTLNPDAFHANTFNRTVAVCLSLTLPKRSPTCHIKKEGLKQNASSSGIGEKDF